MADLQLTIGDIKVATGSVTDTVVYNSQTFDVCLINMTFQKKMYYPTEFHAKLELSLSSTNTDQTWKKVLATDIEDTFKYQKAKLEVVTVSKDDSTHDTTVTPEDTIGEDYYVHDVRPQYQPDSLFVELTICSLDKLLTLNQECNTYVCKTLSDILGDVLPNYKAPYNADTKLTCDVSGMQVLQIDTNTKDDKDNEVMKEHKFPYLVQYNESFYDLLKRTTNRWGEFLFWENGTLNIGYDNASKVKDLGPYTDIYYFDIDDVKLNIPAAGSYDYAAVYDENVANKPIKKDPYQVYGKFGKFNGQGDIYGFSVASRFFQNEESLTTWALGALADDLWDLLAETVYVNSSNKDFNDKYFEDQSEADQYNDKKTELNLYTEYDSEYHKDTTKYSEILGKETVARKNAIRIKYSTNWPKLKLGDLVNVYDNTFIVVEITATCPDELRIENNKYVTVRTGQTNYFEVIAIAQNSDTKFYPATLPTGHVRLSGPQVATIVDMDDPLKANRVRVVYDWQPEGASTDETQYSPWLLYAAGSHGSPRGGRHLNGTKVLVGFVNGNIERPYVLGNIQEADTFVELKDVDLETPGKRKFQMWDHEGGIQKFITGLVSPAVGMISSFSPDVDYWSWSDSDKNLAYAGGFKITDRLGLYNISGSTEEREVKIDSPWGEVKVNAFTGITISAPNGDVKIKGKNVEIAAGNNLKLSSGNNVGYHLAWAKGENPSLSSVLSDICCKIIEKIGEKVQLIDLTFIRSTLEVVFRPQEGCMTLKSNRYMKIETGTDECEYPMVSYSKEKMKKIADQEAKSTILSSIGSSSSVIPGSSVFNLSMLKGLIDIIHKLPGIATAWSDDYRRRYDNLIFQKNLFNSAITNLKKCSNAEDYKNTSVCDDYSTLKEGIWDITDESVWDENNLNFTDNVKVDGNALDIVAEICRTRNRNISFTKKDSKGLAEGIVTKRKYYRGIIVDRVNRLRKSIHDLKPIELSEIDLGKQLSDWVGYFRPYPDDFIKNLKTALSKDNLNGLPGFTPTEDMKNLDKNFDQQADAVLWKKYMARLVVVKFLHSLGFTEELRRQITIDNELKTIESPNLSLLDPNADKSLVNDDYWKNYAESLSGVPAIKKGDTFLSSVADSAKDAVSGTVSFDDIKGFIENFSWTEAKKGGILFGYNGKTYELKGQQIELHETIEPSLKSITETSAGIDKWDKKRLIKFMNALRKEVGNFLTEGN